MWSLLPTSITKNLIIHQNYTKNLNKTNTIIILLQKPRINNLRHSPSDPQLNRPTTGNNVRSRNFTPLSARNQQNNNNNGNNGPARRPNKAQIAPSPKTEIRVAQLKPSVQQTVERGEELITIGEKPYGLDVDSFLPVR